MIFLYMLAIPLIIFISAVLFVLFDVSKGDKGESKLSRLQTIIFEKKIYRYIKEIKTFLNDINSKIKKVEVEISLIPKNEDFTPLKEVKIKVLEKLKETKEIKFKKVAKKLKEELPVILVVKKEHKKAISENKDLMEIYKTYIINKYGKKFIILNVGEFERIMDSFTNGFRYESEEDLFQETFKETIDVIFEEEDIFQRVWEYPKFLYRKEIIQK